MMTVIVPAHMPAPTATISPIKISHCSVQTAQVAAMKALGLRRDDVDQRLFAAEKPRTAGHIKRRCAGHTRGHRQPW